MRHARANMIRGAVLLWIVSPLLIGGGITVAAHLVDDGRKGALVIIAVIVWAIISLVVLLGGFASLLLGVFLWWRSRNPATVVNTTSHKQEQGAVLRDLREELRRPEGAEAGPRVESDSVEPRGRR